MKKTEKRLTDRLIALVLSVVMVISLMPVMSTGAAIASKVADPSTMDSWTDFFDPSNGISTEHAGGVWTDKSVFASVPSGSVLDQAGISLKDPSENFMVVLSALAANSVVTGQNSTPTDVVFVLDISGSMNNSGYMDDMVAAANESIRTLLATNPLNRVGVVLYSDDVYELLPLDHYNGVDYNGAKQYLSLYNGSIITGIRYRSGWSTVTQYITNSQNQYPSRTSVSTGGGTYIQGGLWQGLEVFRDAASSLTGNYSEQVPVLVLLSDGAPTYNTKDYNNVDVGDPSHGAGDSSFAGDGFVTQLTASYVKHQIADIYANAGASDKAYMYTLGLGLDNVEGTVDKAVAKAVLDPSGSAYEPISDLWRIFLNLANGGIMNVGLGVNGNGYYAQDTTTTVIISADKSVTNTQYVDRYFSAAQASSLSGVFRDIVNEINLKSGYYPTHLDDGGSNYSGYVTFADELGNGMAVEQVEGIMIGSKLFTGELLAEAMYITDLIVNQGADPSNYTPEQYLHDGNEPTALGDNVAWAIGQRLRISNAEAQTVLSEAWADGQISYDPVTGEYSNYISWFGDAQGNFLGFCDKDEAERTVPAGAVRINYCYEMLGATSVDGTQNVADLMYVVVQVSTEIATGKQMVVFRVPAALLPVVTYTIDANGETIESSTSFELTYNKADPIRLVYEVGVRDDVNELNYAQYAKKVGNKYYLYTNAWDIFSGNEITENASLNNFTYAYFEPGKDNEHYYFTEDALVLDANLNPVTAIIPGQDYYFQHHVFTAGSAVAGKDNTYNATLGYHEGLLSDAALEIAAQNVNADGYLYVPAGFLHHNLHSHDLYKDETDAPAGYKFVEGGSNITESYEMVRNQMVDAVVSREDGAQHFEIVYLGNNGRLEVVPATGLALTKYVDSTLPHENQFYKFEITFNGVPDGVYNGVSVSGGKATVQLESNETVYIYDLPSGATYTIEEVYSDKYIAKNELTQNASGVIVAGQLVYASFTNTARGTGNLIIEKDVTGHPFTTEQIQSKKFTFEVTLTRADGSPHRETIFYLDQNGVVQDSHSAGGVYTFYLSDNESLTILGLPAGVTYTVQELQEEGFKPLNNDYDKTGTIVAGQDAFVHFINEYVSSPVTVQFKVSIMKEMHGDTMANPETFEFHVDMLENGQYQCDTATKMTITGAGWGEIAVSKEISKIGVYDFRVHEVEGVTPGMMYDSQNSYLRVIVTDNNMDGQLEYSFGDRVDLTAGSDPSIYGAAFDNTYDVEGTTATVKVHKNLENDTGVDIPLTNFHVGLFRDETCNDRVTINGSYYFTFDVLGNLDVHLPIEFDATLADGQSKVITYYLKELAWLTDGIRGLTFDTTIYKVDITVKRNGSAMETVSVAMSTYSGNSSPDGNVAVFNNEYDITPTDITISGEKEISGRHWTDNDQFTIELYQVDSSFVLDAGAVRLARRTVTKDEKNFSFTFNPADLPELRFTSVGQHYFIVKEVGSGRTVDGLTYDTTLYHITVTVTAAAGDAGSTMDKLVADVQVLKVGGGTATVDSVNFTNEYHAAPAEVHLSGIKQIRNTVPGSTASFSLAGYEFTLLEGTTPIQTVVSDASGEFQFDTLYLRGEGIYYYTIKETGDASLVTDGVAHDAADQLVTIIVTDDGRGQLNAQIEGSTSAPDRTALGQFTFTNTYSAAPAKLKLTALKRLEGRYLEPGEFKFILSKMQDAPMPDNAVNGLAYAENAAGGIVTFDEITFTEAGTFVYYVVEDAGVDGTDGIDYDETSYRVEVTVVDDGKGQLVANVTGVRNADTGADADGIEFINKYSTVPAEVTLGGIKQINNTMVGSNATFSLKDYEFVLVGKDGEIETVSSDEQGAFRFDALSFDKSGIYNFVIREKNAGTKVDGISYNAQEWNVTVYVWDNGKGQMVASLVGFNEADGNNNYISVDHVFTNTYAADSVEVTLHGNKVLQNITPTLGGISLGNIALNGGEFGFQLTGDGLSAAGLSATNDALGNFSFRLPAFTAVGEYNFTITEKTGDKAYIGYTAPAVNVTVTVTDNGLGQLVATVGSTPANEYVAQFTNTYTAEGTTLALTGLKDLDGRDLVAGEFRFTLTGLNGAPMPAEATVSNGADGKIVFGDIHFEKVGVYNYTIEEVREADGTDGITYDKAKYNITVTVSDNGDGTTKAVAVSIKDGAVEPGDVVFYNLYQSAPAKFHFGGVKTLNGRELRDGEFKFVLKNESGSVIRSATNNGRNFEFAEVELLAAGTYVFSVEEDATDALGCVTYDKTSHKITVVVKDNGKGQLVSYVNDRAVESVSVAFTNTYTVKPVSLLLTGLKKLDGRELKAGEFEFALKALDGAPLPRGEVNGVYTAKNALGGSIVFPAIEFTAPGVYKYTVEEAVKPDGTNGITYDKTKYELTVTVTDNGDGTMSIEKSIKVAGAAQESQLVFTNTYKTSPVKFTVGGTKTLSGRALKDGEFKFLLKDAEGKVIGTATNKNGKFAFAAVELTKAGTYVFTVEEDRSQTVPGITFDRTKHQITVVVKDNGVGQLVTYVEDQAAESVSVAFTNTYKAVATQITFEGTKTLNGRELADGEFKFLLKDENGKVIGIATNKDSKFVFDAVDFTKVGTYVFCIEEDATDPVPGVTYDKTSHKITVVVTDDGLGNLIASVNGKTANTANVKFTNTFTPDDVRVPIMIQKILENKTGTKIGLDGFRFIITDGKDFTQELVSDKDGKAGLTLTFGPEDAGKTFTFYLSEEDMGATGMTYDEMVYEIKIAITRDEVTGGLTASVTRDGKTATDAATFTNTYFVEEPPKTSDPMNLEMVVGLTAFCATASTMMLAVLLLTDRKARKKVDK